MPKALDAYHQAEKIYEETPLTGTLYMDLATVYALIANHEKANEYYIKALHKAIELYPIEPDYCTDILCSLGSSYALQEKYCQAIFCLEGVEIGFLKLGDKHPKYIELLYVIAFTYITWFECIRYRSPLLPIFKNSHYLRDKAIEWLKKLPKKPYTAYAPFRWTLENLASRNWGEFTNLLIDCLDRLLEGIREEQGEESLEYQRLFSYLQQEKAYLGNKQA
ncbi:MAG: hypothetical protein H2174_02055 [Vampirovibrio sp.]|nr:hypothetical protein [Vampirovibrio sp.]